jgi:anti-sigma B factor antagonist
LNDGEVARVEHQTEGETVIVRVEGDVDAANAAGLHDDISRLLTNHHMGLVLDLSQTRYLDSAGIQMLLDLSERLRSRGQNLAVYVTREQPLRLTLSLFELERAFPVSESLEQALTSIDSSGD